MRTPRLPASASLKGKLLLAAPSMEDGFFEKTVILMIGHSGAKGARGVILNKSLGRTIADELGNGSELSPEISKINIFQGGPVQQDSLNMVSFSRQDGRLLYKHGISREETQAAIQTPGTLVHCFEGYSSWTPGQLEHELEEGTWIVLPALINLLEMDHDQTLWRQILNRTSPMHALLSRAPKHAFLN